MTQSVPAWIRIGGALPRTHLPDLLTAIDRDKGMTDWDGQAITADRIGDGQHLDVYSLGVEGGVFGALERFCFDRGLAFVRSSASSSGAFNAERVVFIGQGAPWHFDMTEREEVVITRAKAKALGSLEAIIAWFDAAEFVPPFPTITEDDAPLHVTSLG